MAIKRKLVSIQGKIILYFVVAILIISVAAGLIQYIERSVAYLEDTRAEVTHLAAAAALLIDGDSHQKLTTPEDQLSDTYKGIKAEMQKFQKEIGVTNIYTLVESGDKARFVVDAAEKDVAALGCEYDYLPAMKSAFNGTACVNKEMYTDKWGTFLSGYAPVRNSSGEVVAIVGVDIDVSNIISAKTDFVKRIIVNIIFNLVLTLILSIFLSGKIAKPIRLLIVRFKELSSAGGDLTQKVEIKTGDELELLGDAVTEFIGNIRDIVKQITDTADSVTSSAEGLNITISENQRTVEEVTNSIQNIASGASKQAGNVNDISDKIQNIAVDINENEKKVKSITESVDETRKLINNGLEAVNNQSIKTEQSMSAFKKVIDGVEKLARESQEVGNILATITNISEQTNLLALNAAIEAARAGEHGRGFSVVADEVRKLSEGSTTAAAEISQILQKINLYAKEAIDEINNADLITKEQKKAVDRTSITFKDITSEIGYMIQSIHTISDSFKDITENTNSIAEKIQGISSASQDSAATAEEVSASSEEQNAAMEEIGATVEDLNSLSGKLRNIISKFQI